MNKYRAKKTVVDGIVFDSDKEARRYQDLKLLVRAGTIKDLELQHVFPIELNGYKICKYKADFVYRDIEGRMVVEDVKGMKSGAAYQMFKLKAKLVEAIYSIRILET